ncbi:hypothetical protein BCT64_16455 [Vibrio breoganii]|nr:hypothetical protein BCT64_16455 [Vibrio breoganii]PMN65015.1 hypothetical protein BCT28_00350 [Vibrio breoganii]
MNPNMNYAQAIPGLSSGREAGIIESRLFINVIDSIRLVSYELDPVLLRNVKLWFHSFQSWLINSKSGIAASKMDNNIALWYDAQLVSISLFINDSDFVNNYYDKLFFKRIHKHLNNEGILVQELQRTRPWGYMNFSMQAVGRLIEYSIEHDPKYKRELLKDDLIKASYMYIADVVLNPSSWDYDEILGFDKNEGYRALVVATELYKDNDFCEAFKKLYDKNRQEYINFWQFKRLVNFKCFLVE